MRRENVLRTYRPALLALIAAALTLASGGGLARAATPSFSAHGSAEQVYVTGLSGGARMALVNRRGRVLQRKAADSLGGLLFRSVAPGSGYRVRLLPHGPSSDALTVYSNASTPWDTSFENQSIPSSGYGYLTTRDGTKLAIYVHPPSDISKATSLPGVTLPSVAPSGPVPTLIEYAGYGYADPAGPQNGIAVVANLMGFAVVDVNMRGTGCSGGAYDFFEPLQNLDGYDVVETIAHQPWVLHNKVGMMGISYGGISQLFTAQTDPPDLAAISPLSVIDSTQTTLYPGGILNTGFALAWAEERIHDALPASPNGGQAWAYQQIQNGDQTCKDNQVLHGEAMNLLAKIHANQHYIPKVADPLAPVTFVNKIKVPVFMACQWTDEQTGGHCPDLAEHMTATSRKWVTFTNGTHIDSLDPYTFDRWYDFLSLYVAQQAPITNSAQVQAGAPAVYDVAMGIAGVTLPPDPIQQTPDYATALSQFEALPPVRILFDSGAGSNGGQQNPGWPYPSYEQSFSRFPVPGTSARTWYLGAAGTLNDQPPRRPAVNAFTWNARDLPQNDFTGNDTGSNAGDLWTASPNYHWTEHPTGTEVSYLTAPLSTDTTVIGAGQIKLWIRSSKPNVDLQATVSEVRPDGNETFVQNGWVRGRLRALDRAKSTLLEPVLSLRARDDHPLPRARYVPVSIPLYYEGHVYRAGSRIRITISAPNGDQPVWAFSQTSPAKAATVRVGFGRGMPSRLILPVVAGVNDPAPLPPCPSLRGEPCRTYVAQPNRTASR